ncbi:NnrU family protein [Roseibium aggregatum]|uniref:NnrU family protein n=1 Tax=Roseibium aggregatum TaxID=187304 RepID=A0A926NXT0_9HYPH|nr:NnrU family protein [Roseibium aggregatum]MBD1549357.1 NnrU family protein [Roseibium aggregatum]
MELLVLGLLVFLGAHALPIFSGARNALVARLGAMPYRGLFSVVSAVGLVLIVMGYGQARMDGSPLLYDPPAWTRHVTMLLMLPVFVLLIATYVPGRIRKITRHPMLVAVKLWALAHLLSNGDLASVLLFGGFLVWAVADRISVKRRGDPGTPFSVEVAGKGPAADIFAIVAGLVVYGLFVWKGHALVIGVPLT